MSKNLKQLIKAYLSYVLGLWGTPCLMLLYSYLFHVQNSEISFATKVGMVIGLCLVAFVAGIPFYIWIAIRQAMLKEKLKLQHLYKYSFVAGFLTPIAYFVATLLRISFRNSNIFLSFNLLLMFGLAECCVRLNREKLISNSVSPDG